MFANRISVNDAIPTIEDQTEPHVLPSGSLDEREAQHQVAAEYDEWAREREAQMSERDIDAACERQERVNANRAELVAAGFDYEYATYKALEAAGVEVVGPFVRGLKRMGVELERARRAALAA